MSVYENELCFLADCPTAKAKVDAIDLIIAALLVAGISGGTDSGKMGYRLDDGQTKIQREYRSAAEIADAITGFERLRNYYISKCTGSIFKLINKPRY